MERTDTSRSCLSLNAHNLVGFPELGLMAHRGAWHLAVGHRRGIEGYAKLSLKKYRPIAARNEDRKVFSGLL